MRNSKTTNALSYIAPSLIAVGALLGGSPASAAPIIGLSLLIDESGSITSSNFALQNTGYINALTAELPTDGSVALEVKTFSTAITSLFALQTITPTTKAALLAAFGSNTQSGGSTATGPAIQAAQADLLSAAFAGLTRRIIDVSTDGFGNVGISETTAATNAVAAGIDQVNVLCIGAAANCAFNKGVGSFDTPATFATFETSLTAKLRREVTVPATVPEPASMAAVGAGLFGLGLMRKRQLTA